MHYCRVGHSGLEVSRLALGTMTWGTVVDAYDAQEQLEAFVDAGGTLVDTAPVHGDGAAEEMVGTLLAKTDSRDRIVLAGKAGLVRRGDGTHRDASRRTLLGQLDESLRRLGTDHFDLWQVHVWDPNTPIEETLAVLEHAVRTGRTRYVGVSNFAAWQIALAQTWLSGRSDGLRLISTQVEYSLVQRGPERELTSAAQHLGMGVLAWSPLGRGVLTGKYRSGIPADSRAADPAWEAFVASHLSPHKLGIVEALARASEGLGVTIAHVALAWLRDRPAVASAIVGARTAEQLRESLASEDVDLPPEIVQALDDVSDSARQGAGKVDR